MVQFPWRGEKRLKRKSSYKANTQPLRLPYSCTSIQLAMTSPFAQSLCPPVSPASPSLPSPQAYLSLTPSHIAAGFYLDLAETPTDRLSVPEACVRLFPEI